MLAILGQGGAEEDLLERGKRAMKEQRTSYRAGLGNYASKVEAAIDDIQNRDLVKRIWAKDHTVWRPDPTEITNRLGWLTVTDTMREQVADLEAFARFPLSTWSYLLITPTTTRPTLTLWISFWVWRALARSRRRRSCGTTVSGSTVCSAATSLS